MEHTQICHCGLELCIAKIDLFRTLARPLQEEIVRRARHFDAVAGETLFLADDDADFILIVREGKVKLHRFDADGKEYILDIRNTGETIGEEHFFSSAAFTYDATSLVPSKLCTVSKALLLEVVQEYEDSMPLALTLIEHLSDRLEQANSRISLLMEDNGLKRVAGFILERIRRLKGTEVELTIDDIAGSTNLRRETVSRKLTELQKQGLIQRLGQKRLQILDEEQLLEITLEN